jgi:hypothetical protein
VREFAKSICTSRATVWRRLTGSLGFVVKHLHWPRSPPDRCATTNSNGSVKRIAQTLECAQANDWQSFMTLNESWFYLWTSHEKVWVQAGQQPLKG